MHCHMTFFLSFPAARLLLYQMLPVSLCCLVRNTAEGSTQSGKHSIQRNRNRFLSTSVPGDSCGPCRWHIIDTCICLSDDFISLDCSCIVIWHFSCHFQLLGCYCIKCCRYRYAVLCGTLQKAARSLANIAFSEQEPLFEYFCTWWFLRAVSVTHHWYMHMPVRRLYILGLFMHCHMTFFLSFPAARLLLYQMLPVSLCCLVRNTAEGSTQSGKHSIQRTGTAFWVLLYLVILAGRLGDNIIDTCICLSDHFISWYCLWILICVSLSSGFPWFQIFLNDILTWHYAGYQNSRQHRRCGDTWQPSSDSEASGPRLSLVLRGHPYQQSIWTRM